MSPKRPANEYPRTVEYDRDRRRWVALVADLYVIAHAPAKRALISTLALQCRYQLQAAGYLAELRIKNRAGRYQPARTYGRDPRRSKG